MQGRRDAPAGKGSALPPGRHDVRARRARHEEQQGADDGQGGEGGRDQSLPQKAVPDPGAEPAVDEGFGRSQPLRRKPVERGPGRGGRPGAVGEKSRPVHNRRGERSGEQDQTDESQQKPHRRRRPEVHGPEAIAAAPVLSRAACARAPRGAMRLASRGDDGPRVRRGGRAAEGARLESVYTGNRIAGSNPAPSARKTSGIAAGPQPPRPRLRLGPCQRPSPVARLSCNAPRVGGGDRRGAMSKIPAGVGPKLPQAVVLFGATGDLSQRKLLPGLFHLIAAGFIPRCRIIGVSLDDITPDDFRVLARKAIEMHHDHAAGGGRLAGSGRGARLRPDRGGRAALAAAVEAEPAKRSASSGSCIISACRRARRSSAVRHARARPGSPRGPASSWKSRSAPTSRARSSLNAQLHEVFAERPDLPHRPFPRQGAGAEHPRFPLRQRSVRADLEPQLHRPRADRRARDARASATAPASTSRPAPTATWS